MKVVVVLEHLLTSPSLGALRFSPKKHSRNNPRVRVKNSGLELNFWNNSSSGLKDNEFWNWKKNVSGLISRPSLRGFNFRNHLDIMHGFMYDLAESNVSELFPVVTLPLWMEGNYPWKKVWSRSASIMIKITCPSAVCIHWLSPPRTYVPTKDHTLPKELGKEMENVLSQKNWRPCQNSIHISQNGECI